MNWRFLLFKLIRAGKGARSILFIAFKSFLDFWMDTTQKIVKIQQCFISIAEMGKIKIAKLSGAKNGARSDFFHIMKNYMHWIQKGYYSLNYTNSTIFHKPKMGKFKLQNRVERQKERADNFFSKQKIPCVRFWMENGQKFFQFRPFLLIQ